MLCDFSKLIIFDIYFIFDIKGILLTPTKRR